VKPRTEADPVGKHDHWVVDADLKSYFDSIPQEGLMKRMREKIA
jgi:retron-type reverse transcriptase